MKFIDESYFIETNNTYDFYDTKIKQWLDKCIKQYTNHDVKITQDIFNSLNNKKENTEMKKTLPAIKNVVFNDPLTIIVWADGTKTYVKASGGDDFDPEKGMALAIAKKAMGNKYEYFETIREWIKKDQKRKAKKWKKEQKAKGRIIGNVVKKEATEEGVTAKVELTNDGVQFIERLKNDYRNKDFTEKGFA